MSALNRFIRVSVATLLLAVAWLAAVARADGPPARCGDVAGQPRCVAWGRGLDARAAQRDAIRNAIEAGCDAAVDSRREWHDEVAGRNDLVIYRGCMVSEFEELERKGSDPVEVRIAATLARSRLPERLLGAQPEWFEFDVRAHSARLYSAQLRLENRPKLIQAILEDYPTRAFLVESREPRIRYEREPVPGSASRVREFGIVNVEVSLRWNPAFIGALEDALKLVEDAEGPPWPRSTTSHSRADDINVLSVPVTVVTGAFAVVGNVAQALASIARERKEGRPPPPRDPAAVVVLNRTHAFYDEGVHTQVVEWVTNGRHPVLQVSLVDPNGATVARACEVLPHPVYGGIKHVRRDVSMKYLRLDPTETWGGTVPLRVPDADGDLRVGVEVVPLSTCVPSRKF